MSKSERIPMETYPGWVQIIETMDDNRRTIHHYEKAGYLIAFVPALGGWVVIDSNTSIFKFRDSAFKYANILINLDELEYRKLEEYEIWKENGF